MDRIASLPNELDCSAHVLFADDVYFYDRMSGVVCFFPDHSRLVAHVYEHESSVDQVLDRWEYLLHDPNRIVVGANWFAIGTQEQLVRLGTILGMKVDPVSAVVTHPVPLTERQEFIGDCSSWTVIAIRDYIFDPTEYAQTIEYYEMMFPGLTEIVMKIAPEVNKDSTLTEINADAKISFFGRTIKSFCGQLAPGTP